MLCDGNEVSIMTDGNPVRVERNFNNRWVGLGLFYSAVAADIDREMDRLSI